MGLSEQDINILLEQCLTIGEAMYHSGAEISRVEEALRYIGAAYGAHQTSVFATTSNILLTMEFENGAFTASRRIVKPDHMNLDRLARLNGLCRRVTSGPVPVEELRRLVHEAEDARRPSWKALAGQILAAGSFAVFFGGGAAELIAAAAGAAAVHLLEKILKPVCRGRVFLIFLLGFFAGGLEGLACRALPALQFPVIMTALIMILVPGVAVTNSLRYTISGDTISGIEKLVESLLVTCGMAAGISLAIFLLGRF